MWLLTVFLCWIKIFKDMLDICYNQVGGLNLLWKTKEFLHNQILRMMIAAWTISVSSSFSNRWFDNYWVFVKWLGQFCWGRLLLVQTSLAAVQFHTIYIIVSFSLRHREQFPFSTDFFLQEVVVGSCGVGFDKPQEVFNILWDQKTPYSFLMAYLIFWVWGLTGNTSFNVQGHSICTSHCK